MGIFIRRAEQSDYNWLVEQMSSFSDFFGSKKKLFGNMEHIKKTLPVFIDTHVFLIAEKSGLGPVGFISGFIGPHPFNPDIEVLTETFWWVTPEYRGGRAGILLLNEFIEMGKECCDWIVMSVEHNSPINEDCLTKRGFSMKERAYIMEV